MVDHPVGDRIGKRNSQFDNVDAARFAGGKPGVLHGTYTYVLQNPDGQISLTHSVSAGLDYAAVGPEHCYLREEHRIQFSHVTDDQALAAFQEVGEMEGILPALESAHALAYLKQNASKYKPDDVIIVNLSGRGDKDVEQVHQLIQSKNESNRSGIPKKQE